jgi:hypothetical protein
MNTIKEAMTNLILARKDGDVETPGTYLVIKDDQIVYQCKCLELAWLNNERNKSCIPAGVYALEKYSDMKHPNCFWIKDVPGRDGILIHPGNFATGIKIDTEGCQIAGIDFLDIDGNGTLDIVHPDIAMAALNHFLPDKCKLYII